MADFKNIFKQKIFSEHPTRFFENFISLSSIHALNSILSLITVPYLTRTLGPSNFGLAGFIAAFMTYFTVFTDYGFNLSATKDIACNRHSTQEVSRIFSTVMSVKLMLGAISFVLLCCVVVLVDMFNSYLSLYFICFLGVIGNILFPAWLFQGFEQMKYLSYINGIIKALSTAAIFIYITNSSDTIVFIWIYSLSSLMTGVLGMATAFIIFNVRVICPTIDRIKVQLKEGGYVFLSSAGTLLYTSSTAFVLGLFTSHEIVGYFSGADKIRLAIQGLFTPVFQTLYPYVSNLARLSKQQAWNFVKIETGVVVVAGITLCPLLYIYADRIALLVLGEAYARSAEILKILSIVPALTLLGNVLTIQYMLCMGYYKEYLNIYIIASTIGLISIIVFSYFRGANGTAWAVVLAESTVLVLTIEKIKATRKTFAPVA